MFEQTYTYLEHPWSVFKTQFFLMRNLEASIFDNWFRYVLD